MEISIIGYESSHNVNCFLYMLTVEPSMLILYILLINNTKQEDNESLKSKNTILKINTHPFHISESISYSLETPEYESKSLNHVYSYKTENLLRSQSSYFYKNPMEDIAPENLKPQIKETIFPSKKLPEIDINSELFSIQNDNFICQSPTFINLEVGLSNTDSSISNNSLQTQNTCPQKKLKNNSIFLEEKEFLPQNFYQDYDFDEEALFSLGQDCESLLDSSQFKDIDDLCVEINKNEFFSWDATDSASLNEGRFNFNEVCLKENSQENENSISKIQSLMVINDLHHYQTSDTLNIIEKTSDYESYTKIKSHDSEQPFSVYVSNELETSLNEETTSKLKRSAEIDERTTLKKKKSSEIINESICSNMITTTELDLQNPITSNDFFIFDCLENCKKLAHDHDLRFCVIKKKLAQNRNQMEIDLDFTLEKKRLVYPKYERLQEIKSVLRSWIHNMNTYKNNINAKSISISNISKKVHKFFSSNRLCICFLEFFYCQTYTFYEFKGNIFTCDQIFIYNNADRFKLWICFNFATYISNSNGSPKITYSEKNLHKHLIYDFKNEFTWFFQEYKSFLVYRKSLIPIYLNKHFKNISNDKIDLEIQLADNFFNVYLSIFTLFRRHTFTVLVKETMMYLSLKLMNTQEIQITQIPQNCFSTGHLKNLVDNIFDFYIHILKNGTEFIILLCEAYSNKVPSFDDPDLLLLFASHIIKCNQILFVEYFLFLIPDKKNSTLFSKRLKKKFEERFLLNISQLRKIKYKNDGFFTLEHKEKVEVLLGKFIYGDNTNKVYAKCLFGYFLGPQLKDIVFNSLLVENILIMYEYFLARSAKNTFPEYLLLKNILRILIAHQPVAKIKYIDNLAILDSNYISRALKSNQILQSFEV